MMRSEFKGADGKVVSYLKWADVAEPIGVIQVSHGMAEHAGRYDIFAKAMNERGFIVVADDHRAHGITDGKNLGYSEGNIWENTLSDLAALCDAVKAEYGLPVVFFGHSYGSFLTQAFIRRYSGLAGAVVGGSNYLAGATPTFGRIVAAFGKKFKGGDKPAFLLKKASFDVYDKKFDGGSFISSVPEECERYKADEHCDFICSHAFYYYFFDGAKKLYKKGGIPLADFPILLIAGRDDPVGNMGKGVLKLEKWYERQGADVRCVLYDGVRHEFLNDVSRQAAFDEIYVFAAECVKKATLS